MMETLMFLAPFIIYGIIKLLVKKPTRCNCVKCTRARAAAERWREEEVEESSSIWQW